MVVTSSLANQSRQPKTPDSQEDGSGSTEEEYGPSTVRRTLSELKLAVGEANCVRFLKASPPQEQLYILWSV